jgi:hypothetical protein
MAPAASQFLIGSQFNDFLYASIGEDANEMPLSVLSALTRLNIDPWLEASQLSKLPKDTATQRLASLIAQCPTLRLAQADSQAAAARLIQLLPSLGRSDTTSSDRRVAIRELLNSRRVILIIAVVLVATVLLLAARCELSSGDDADQSSLAMQSSVQRQ